jgi:hypothetical protein
MRAFATVLIVSMLAGAAWAAPQATDAWIASLEGGWTGEDNATPMGQMPFTVLFDRGTQGELRAHSALNRETYIDLRFVKDDEGRWLLEEHAALEGLGEQAHTLVPVEAPGTLRRWIRPDSPDYLRVDVAIDGKTLFMDVVLRGKPHAQFQLDRIPDDELPRIREAMAAAAERDPQQASIHDFANERTVPAAILEARRAVAAAPSDARARLRLGQAIGELLTTDSMTYGPQFAGEMLATLERALELDPTIPETYRWLAGYYLNAPPIAGGSIEKAETLAHRLGEIDAEAGSDLLATVQRARAGASGKARE